MLNPGSYVFFHIPKSEAVVDFRSPIILLLILRYNSFRIFNPGD